MAVAVATSQTGGANSATSVTITKPTGLAVGDGLVAAIYAYNTVGGSTNLNTPSGWEKMQDIVNSAAADSHRIALFTKVADSSDVAASNFTFDSSFTMNWQGILMRTTGSRTDDIYDGKGATGDSSDTTDPEVYSSLSVTPSQDTVLLIAAHAAAQNESFSDSTSPVVNGTNPTWTKQYNGNFDVFTAPVATTAEITSISFTMSSSGGFDTVMALAVINGQNDGNATLTLTSTSNTAFAPTGRAGASLTIGAITETVQETFTTTGNSYDPTAWTTINKS